MISFTIFINKKSSILLTQHTHVSKESVDRLNSAWWQSVSCSSNNWMDILYMIMRHIGNILPNSITSLDNLNVGGCFFVCFFFFLGGDATSLTSIVVPIKWQEYFCRLNIILTFTGRLWRVSSHQTKRKKKCNRMHSVDNYWTWSKYSVYVDKFWGGARGVMVIEGNRHGDTSSNPGPGWLHFT